MAPVLAQSAKGYLRPRVFHVYPEFSTRARVSHLDPVFSTRPRVFHTPEPRTPCPETPAPRFPPSLFLRYKCFLPRKGFLFFLLLSAQKRDKRGSDCRVVTQEIWERKVELIISVSRLLMMAPSKYIDAI